MRAMILRAMLFISAALALAGCEGFGQCPGVGPCTGRTVASPYDQADLYVDSQGFPLPGWAQMKYGTESGSSK